ncbi:MAG: aldo/keto reductase [Acidimicrobiia bacterium]|nr:aldo/keto reductase [Acidimicrobiia bacterium]
MEMRNIGALPVSVVGLGCNNFGMTIDAEASRAVVEAALDAGINYFDTADIYGGGKSEEFLGAALDGRRDRAVIASKFGHAKFLPEGQQGGDPAWVRRCVDRSLRRLGTDRIDHYMIHTPDPHTPQAETLGALAELVEEGKVLEIGCSNFTADLVDASVDAAAEVRVGNYASVQNHYSVLTRDVEDAGVLDACSRAGMAVVPFFPLESGLLTGKYSEAARPDGARLTTMKGGTWDRFLRQENLAAVDRLTVYATERGRSILELAMGWLVSNPAVASVIAGATKPSQVADNVAAVNWTMSPAQRAEIAALA